MVAIFKQLEFQIGNPFLCQGPTRGGNIFVLIAQQEEPLLVALRLRLARRTHHVGPVVVQWGCKGPLLAERILVGLDVLVGGGARLHLLENRQVVGAQGQFGQTGALEEVDVPHLAKLVLFRCGQRAVHIPWWAAHHDVRE